MFSRTCSVCQMFLLITSKQNVKTISTKVYYDSCNNWFKSFQSVIVCWFLTHTFPTVFFASALQGYCLCVFGSGRVGGVGVVFSFFSFFLFDEILSMELYLFKTFDCETCFCSWWYLKANVIKSGHYGTFMSHPFRQGGGDWTFQPCYLISFLVLNKWVSPPLCCPSRFSIKSLHAHLHRH